MNESLFVFIFLFFFPPVHIIERALAEFKRFNENRMKLMASFCLFVLFVVSVCSSKDIRNSVKNFNELKNCRVIEGFLMITLIDKYNETDYDNLTFPELTEVTEFLLLYRVNGLKSLGKLFPNLRIIRGNTLIHDFSFIIFEMMHLQVIF